MAPDNDTKGGSDNGQDFYVGLLDSEHMQRELLEARKNALILLKRFQKAVLLREQRLYLEGEIRSAIKDLSSEIHEVMASFPDLPPEEIKKPEPKKPAPKKAAVKPAPKKMNELDRKLAEIDKRLSELE